MPEHLRALIVILPLAVLIFSVARKPALEFVSTSLYSRRRNLWLALCLLAFLSHSFWVYAAIATLFLLVLQRTDPLPIALFFFLLFLLPAASVEVPGLGLINYLIALNHPRLLSLVILLPAFVSLRRTSEAPPFGRFVADKLLLSYLLLVILLQMRATSLTDTLRQSVYLFLDVFLPYYVASRSVRNIASFKDALLFFVLASMVLAVIGIFESNRHWLLYRTVIDALGIKWGYTGYLGRGDALRASASVGQPIALGYVMAVAFGMYLYLYKHVRSKLIGKFGGLLIIGGAIASLSRGPWIGLAVVCLAFVLTGRAAAKKIVLIAIAGLVALPFIAAVPGGQKIINLLPFIGNVETENITYRERLIDNALIVIQRSPWLGSVDYQAAPEMEVMRQGQGIIDIVNTYIGIALEYGFLGLALFVSFFLSVLYGVFKTMRSLKQVDEEMNHLGRALFATLAGILVIIFTVSSITVIPIVYWSVSALCVAYVQLARQRLKHLQAGTLVPQEAYPS